MKKTKIILISLSLMAVSFAGAFGYLYWNNFQQAKKIIAPEAAAERAVQFINTEILKGNSQKAKLENVENLGEIYRFTVNIGGKKYISFVTRDGSYVFPEGYKIPQNLSQKNSGTNVPKREKPDVKLFVMSYCPFGLQAEKMFLPVWDLLKDKASMGIYFVDYAMHGKKEVDENLRQYCIQKEEPEKYRDYLGCFVLSGDSQKCLSKAKIDSSKIDKCEKETDSQYHINADYNDKSKWISGRFPPFDIYKSLNDKYNVQGSPTVVINDKVVQISPRSPETLKEAICNAFKNPPSECSEKLSDKVPSPGIGGGEASNSGGSCQ